MRFINNYSEAIRKLNELNVQEAIMAMDKNFLNYYGIKQVIGISSAFYKKIYEDFNGIGSLYIIRGGTECYLIQILDTHQNNHLIYKLKRLKNTIILDD